jgi:hypothetical protein
MNKQFIDINLASISFNTDNLTKNNWLVLLHYKRIPPHVGMIVNGNYNSLTIKGQETNISLQVLNKTIQQKKIEACFIQLEKQPVFSSDYQLEILQHYIKQYKSVQANYATCLSPIKLFLNEFYGLDIIADELLFELIIRLNSNKFILNFMPNSQNNNSKVLQLPCYTNNQLHEIILNETQIKHKI